MDRRTTEYIIQVCRPIYLALRFLVIAVDKVLFGWLYILWQRRGDIALARDIRTNLHFLFPVGEIIKERWYRVLPFDYASVRLNYENIRFCFTQGRETLTVSMSPHGWPQEVFELSVVLAALDSADMAEQKQARSMSDLGDLLRPRLAALNGAFSVTEYPKFREKLGNVKKDLHVIAKQAEWALNRNLYR